ncbi:D-alanyl-lipoteichoic acid biosynthesis protein DltD [Lactococcus termiticola]|uniref:Protein DltD n=1 Tax=Lactococcus termiticola TaxID=2169526 RepID=A0A2R5HI23_9LACT|nr:D-alanyl-lipoteichoic acid biosynthesis protein DltD [Lactococcus termiticola]GBG97115.1 D-alanyl transfer protein DltD [Lactococcus termiticola]
MKKHKIWNHILPVIFAFILVGLVIFGPWSITPKYAKDTLKEVAINPKIREFYIGSSVKDQALADKTFLPIMGSSELEHFDAFHPSSFFAKYDPKVTPYLIGAPGTQSLANFYYLSSTGNRMKNRKIVFIISPQWFSKKGTSEAELSNFVSKDALYSWLKSADPKDKATQSLAKRMLGFKSLDDPAIVNAMRQLAAGHPIYLADKLQIDAGSRLHDREDALFSGLNLGKLKLHPENLTALNQELPDKLNFDELDKLAYEAGEKASDNNKYQVKNSVWTKNLAPQEKQRKDSMKNVSYLQSPEYSDFQQLLNLFAKNHDDVQFVIQPVNGAWYSYTGLSYDKLEDFSNKITYQLQSQGFTNILDLTDKYNEKYYVEETIHFGNRGWLAVDKQIQSFLKAPSQTDYTLDNEEFLSPEWDNDNFDQ